MDNRNLQLESAKLALEILTKKRAPSTARKYDQAVKMLLEVGLSPQRYAEGEAAAGFPLSPSRYYTLKASWQRHLATEIKAAVDEVSRLVKSGCQKGDPRFSPLFRKWRKLGRELLDLQPDYDRTRHAQGLPPAVEAPTTQKHLSKRQFLAKLKRKDPHWPVSIINAMPDHLQFQTLVLEVVGCRLAELKKGVEFRVEGGHLLSTIKGAKVSARSGHERRRLLFVPTTETEKALYDAVRQAGGSHVVRLEISDSGYRKQFAKAVTSALGKHYATRCSPVSFRHAFTADIKKGTRGDGDSAEKVALALGHISDRAQAYYGLAKQAQGTRGLVEASGSRPVTIHGGGYSKPNQEPTQ